MSFLNCKFCLAYSRTMISENVKEKGYVSRLFSCSAQIVNRSDPRHS